MKKISIYLTIFLLVNIYTLPAYSQCAMCTKAAAEGTKNGKKIGLGLNSGILLLLSMPYTATMVIGGLWFYNTKAKKKKLLEKSRLIDLNYE
jgi:hypothetical protein